MALVVRKIEQYISLVLMSVSDQRGEQGRLYELGVSRYTSSKPVEKLNP